VAKSYLGFPCINCKTPLKAFELPADAPTPQPRLRGEIRLQCPECGQDVMYPLGEMRRFEQWQMHGT
jgi:hypothetical protein